MRRTDTQSWLLTMLSALALWALPMAANAESVGFIAKVRGVVEVSAGGSTSWSAAAVDRDIEIGDVIRTGVDSEAKLLFDDDTTLTVADETELVIDEFVVGPRATEDPSVIQLVSGHVRTRVGEAFGGTTRLEMHTPTAVIGVKGTIFDCWVYDEEQKVNTLCCTREGRIFIRNIDTTIGGSFEPPVGECARVLPRLAPTRALLPSWLGGTPPVGAGPAAAVLAPQAAPPPLIVSPNQKPASNSELQNVVVPTLPGFGFGDGGNPPTE